MFVWARWRLGSAICGVRGSWCWGRGCWMGIGGIGGGLLRGGGMRGRRRSDYDQYWFIPADPKEMRNVVVLGWIKYACVHILWSNTFYRARNYTPQSCKLDRLSSSPPKLLLLAHYPQPVNTVNPILLPIGHIYSHASCINIANPPGRAARIRLLSPNHLKKTPETHPSCLRTRTIDYN
jgi:hypothetical protein